MSDPVEPDKVNVPVISQRDQRLRLLPDDLHAAILNASARLNDDTIIAEIGADNRPGLVTVTSHGGDVVRAGLHEAEAIEYLAELL